jgi:hypothetical protein
MQRRLRVRSVAATIMALGLMFGSQVARAAVVDIDGIDLSGDNATWDLEADFAYGSGGPCVAKHGFTPAEDGSWDDGITPKSDAFDGGLYIVVDGKTFDDNDGNGTKKGQTMKVGPTTMSRLNIRRTERALQTSPTLRSLVTLQNPTNDVISLPVIWDSAVGSDDSEATRASSDGDTFLTKTDRWFVSSDDPTSPSDPTVTMALYGKGPLAEKVAKVIWAPEDDPPDPPGEGCISLKYSLKIPAKSTRYLMFFTEMNDTNENAIASAAKFNSVKAGNDLLVGLSDAVMGKILNWNL